MVLCNMAYYSYPILRPFNSLLKRSYDLLFALSLLFFFWPVILIAWFIASLETRSNGFFFQVRVGRQARLFRVIKIRTMHPSSNTSTVSISGDSRITISGRFFRRLKIDELPQLFNVIFGDMSMVGPRPDVPGFADRLVGVNRDILLLKPGITGPASLAYSNEEDLLASVSDPELYNASVIWPHKVELNLSYLRHWSPFLDLRLLFQTVFNTNFS